MLLPFDTVDGVKLIRWCIIFLHEMYEGGANSGACDQGQFLIQNWGSYMESQSQNHWGVEEKTVGISKREQQEKKGTPSTDGWVSSSKSSPTKWYEGEW